MAIYPAETLAQAQATQALANQDQAKRLVYQNGAASYNAGAARYTANAAAAARAHNAALVAQNNAAAASDRAKGLSDTNIANAVQNPAATATYNPSATAALNGQILGKESVGAGPQTQIYNAASAPTQQVAAYKPPTATYAMQPIAKQAPAPAVNPMASRINAIGSAITGGYQ